ncbi:Transcription factor [Penicillium canescens]|uniref:Transcription factor n=1 Tax=Penicillium canescens TaxID=5083 RepID=A0AAD6I8E0_PENCN|nr:Transcription factor [Penicillium canescens]KAJ6019971.1 Transcription factor [Penicillium canescens]KAJ6037901.1 Transcription factor [Penicillium canescens]KAJ6045317.1 Transcription factor [Penicillium canescens]KAJ6061018.1 Transcription factor [Penicillium canescens]KAJ6088867.1 Transcription factor [Penicillium canescens]
MCLNIPWNPSDAWQYLRGIANGSHDCPETPSSAQRARTAYLQLSNTTPADTVDLEEAYTGLMKYRLVQNGTLDAETVLCLVQLYASRFHSYFPVVPKGNFDPHTLNEFASAEKYLFTAVLTISSKSLDNMQHIHESCCEYMRELLSEISFGADCDIDAVEALLLLAQWEPPGLLARVGYIGNGEEDRAAWMHVGLALRAAQFLGLERAFVPGESAEPSKRGSRQRLTWIGCYMSDRLLSTRLGRSFSPSSPGNTVASVYHEFSVLQPTNPEEDAQGKTFQAHLELIQMHSNFHMFRNSDICTTDHATMDQDHLKSVEELLVAMSNWHRIWGILACEEVMITFWTPRFAADYKTGPIHLKATLQMAYEYLRFDVNALAVKSEMRRAKSSDLYVGCHDDQDIPINHSNGTRDFPFMHDAIDAAKMYLNILANCVDPEEHLKFMPLRYYL